MKQLTCVWMPLILAIACGDSRDTTADSNEQIEHGRTPEEGRDGGADVDAAMADRGLGAACHDGAHDCDEAMANCLDELSVLSQRVEFSGGYCSAPCADSESCGEHGGCPIGETQAELAGTPMGALFANLPSNCLRRCVEASDCRRDEGYDCKPMTAAMPEQLRTIALGVLADKPITKQAFCVPVRER